MSAAAEENVFDDGKAPDAFRTIGEVSRALGLAPHVLRYWEEQFPMLRPMKRGGGRRYYRLADIEMVRTIDRLVHHDGLTLRGARRLLETRRAHSGDGDAGSALLPRLLALRGALARALDAA